MFVPRRLLAGVAATLVLAAGTMSATGTGEAATVKKAITPVYHPGTKASPIPGALSYGGGIGGVGIQTNPKIYVVFWGAQWGGSSVNGDGDLVFSGDVASMAPRLQRMYHGLYGSETWTNSNEQYCDGPGVFFGDTFCSPSSAHPQHPTSDPVLGVWYDNAQVVPKKVSDSQIRSEALKAVSHFGVFSASANRNAQYIIVLPHNVVPKGFKKVYCAWHSWTSSSSGNIAYTNLPYIPDAGTGCGRNFVNPGSAGLLDGVTAVAGHEYAETVTDVFPNGGWLDDGGNENADKCSWVRSAYGNVPLATGTFTMQGLWSNELDGCALG